MRVECHRPSLAAAFQIVSSVVPSRTTKDILRRIKIEVGDGQATLTGTDLEVGVRYAIPEVSTASSGEALLPTGQMAQILREVIDDRVELEFSDQQVTIHAGQSVFRLSTEAASEYPALGTFEPVGQFALEGRVLRELIRRSVFAADEESTRYALGGVAVDVRESQITFAATDTRRLAVARATCLRPPQGAFETIPVIPRKAMQLVERSIPNDETEVVIGLRGSDVQVLCGPTLVYARLVEGRFPNYRDVLPQQSQVMVDFVAGPLYAAVRQSQIITSEESRGVDFRFENGSLTLQSRAADLGESTISIPMTYDSEPRVVQLDPRYVSDFLKVIDPETNVQVRLNGADDAVLLTAGDAYSYVVMPMARD